MEQLLGAGPDLCRDGNVSGTANHVEENVLPLRLGMVVEKLDADALLAPALVARGRHAKRAVRARAFNRLAQAALEARRQRVRRCAVGFELRVENVQAPEDEEGLLALFARRRLEPGVEVRRGECRRHVEHGHDDRLCCTAVSSVRPHFNASVGKGVPRCGNMHRKTASTVEGCS
jgi:hypothetical protein